MTALSENMRGASLMMGSMAAFTLNDVCMKALSDEMPMFQALFLRGIASIVILVVMARWVGPLNFRINRRDWGLALLRSLAEVGAAYFFITALFNMPLANVTAVLQALPLTVTLAGALLFGEKVGWRRMLAILIGFVGVMVIVRPSAAGFNIYAIYALIAVACVTVRDMCASRLSPKVSSITVALIGGIGVLIFAGIGSLGIQWAPISSKGAMQLSGATIFIIGGYMFSIMTMRVGEISFIAPFRYTSLIWALLLGFMVFGDWPDSLTLLGICIVVTTGVFTFYREHRLAEQLKSS